MGMSEWYGAADWDESIATIHRALDLGVTFIDTADVYGAGHNEVLVGRAIHGRRDEVQLATKFGIDRVRRRRSRGRSAASGYVRAGLRRLAAAARRRARSTCTTCTGRRRPPRSRRPSARWPSWSPRARCATSGLSEVDGDLLRRAHAVHPITAVQSEYSLWTRDVETDRPGRAAELGVGLVPYSPLGRGFLTGTVDLTSSDERDFRSRNPRFTGEAGEANQAIADAVARVADASAASPRPRSRWPGCTARATRLGVAVGAHPGHQAGQVARAERRRPGHRLTAEDLAVLDALADRVVGAALLRPAVRPYDAARPGRRAASQAALRAGARNRQGVRPR